MAANACVDASSYGGLGRWLRPATGVCFNGPRGEQHVGAAFGVRPPAAKRARCCVSANMHGVALSDHAEKTTWSGYWEERERKLKAQPVDAGLYGAIANQLCCSAIATVSGGVKPNKTKHCPGTACSFSSTAPRTQPNQLGHLPQTLSSRAVLGEKPGMFHMCCIYFNGRVDGVEGLSSFALGKVFRLHGGELASRLTQRAVTHVVCTQLSSAKERKALRMAQSRGSSTQYFVLPEWITQSVAAGHRLCERRFSVLAQVAMRAGLGSVDTPFASATTTPFRAGLTILREGTPNTATYIASGAVAARDFGAEAEAARDAYVIEVDDARTGGQAACIPSCVLEIAATVSQDQPFDDANRESEEIVDRICDVGSDCNGSQDVTIMSAAVSRDVPATALDDDTSTMATDSDDEAPSTELDSDDDAVRGGDGDAAVTIARGLVAQPTEKGT
eukprot:TRINITY_DN55177_c0_g1_i1.p1 TRINITY_DN55177_c0_g1~~TRINITY_DN55177_c0_g1_i1.p1  ORF type:complete len:446 (+),score=67.06 TRINITY_DN55177_c0_g1_i1:44-1381(+)